MLLRTSAYSRKINIGDMRSHRRSRCACSRRLPGGWVASVVFEQEGGGAVRWRRRPQPPLPLPLRRGRTLNIHPLQRCGGGPGGAVGTASVVAQPGHWRHRGTLDHPGAGYLGGDKARNHGGGRPLLCPRSPRHRLSANHCWRARLLHQQPSKGTYSRWLVVRSASRFRCVSSSKT